MGPGQEERRGGRVGASFHIPLRKGERHFQAACVTIGIKQEVHRWFLSEGQNRGALWFATASVRQTHQFPHCLQFCPFSCLFPDGAGACCLSAPPQLLCSQNASVLHQRRLRALPQPSARSGCPSTASGSRTWARAALRSRPPSVVSGPDVNVL